MSATRAGVELEAFLMPYGGFGLVVVAKDRREEPTLGICWIRLLRTGRTVERALKVEYARAC